jgi:hypothetical protein
MRTVSAHTPAYAREGWAGREGKELAMLQVGPDGDLEIR